MSNTPHNSEPEFRPVEWPEWTNAGPGKFPWDAWQTKAVAAGVPDDLATFGRSVMREAYQHSWDPPLQRECGMEDEGQQMIDDVLQTQEEIRLRWSYLLYTDGNRSELPDEVKGEYP
ncbi:MAG TPA: hypothetical protein EYG03_30255 [Planctomycetes bacterium]|nr:hypothetical protein [Fuerstiella sp.]HIK96247.1 hypothetical protein [Planctomycetota bacterium]